MEQRSSDVLDFSEKEHSGIFSSNLTTQKQAWQKVSEMMCLEGHHFKGEECDRKFRSLKMRQVVQVYFFMLNNLHVLCLLNNFDEDKDYNV